VTELALGEVWLASGQHRAGRSARQRPSSEGCLEADVHLAADDHPTPVTNVGGGVGLAASVLAIVMLVRVNPRRKPRLVRRAAAPGELVAMNLGEAVIRKKSR